jgi:DsbC/DsbD-like thiol-disulfide interchange protein
MTLNSFWTSLLLALPLAAQAPAPVLSIAEPAKVTVKRNEPATQVLKISLKPGYHVNSNAPNDKSLIPLRLTWDDGMVETVSITYPKAHIEKSEFSEEPLSVFSGDFEIVSRIRRKASAQPGPAYLTGKLRYQACNDKMCLPPRSLDVKVPLLIE